MLGTLVAVVVLAAPGPGEVGSVDGPFAWVDLHGALETEALDPVSTVNSPYFRSRGLSAAAQAQLFGGWGLPLAGQRLTLSAALQGTLLPAPFNLGGSNLRQTLYQLSPLQLAASAPLQAGPVVVVPMLAFALPTVGFLDTRQPPLTLTPRVEVRGRVADVLLGASASFGVLLAPPVRNRQSRCDQDAAACRMFPEERWRAHLRLQAEYFVLPALSLAARLDLDLRDEYFPGMLATANTADATLVLDPGQRTFEVRPGVELTWAFTDHLGLTLSLAGAERFATITPPELRAPPGALTAWQAGLSLWFRTDPRLQRAWLER